MASDESFVKYVIGQMAQAGEMSYRSMFEGVTYYCNGKVVALICDDQLFVKPTEGGKSFIGSVV